jgi:rhamnose utilization protein RhaD (predicted bifunctional aldolase and dehydrogenase)/NAD(P)-dependent dehydrogenase (short-subunit alcohol dehydrogenase family)
MKETMALCYLEDRWDKSVAATLNEAELLRYRSNLLGSDLRITNYGGGNTSAKLTQPDPLDGSTQQVLWVKGSGGDLGTISTRGFATLYLDKLHGLTKVYRGVAHEDDMVGMYPLCAFGQNSVAASIDTSLHAFLPARHVDHLHPDWGIALAAAANGEVRMQEFNRRFGHHLVWIPWQRPGFELGMMLKNAVAANPQCDGIVLGGHGLFSWGETSEICYRNTIELIDQLGQFIQGFVDNLGPRIFGGAKHSTHENREAIATDLLPYLRGRLSKSKRVVGNYSALPEVLRFANAQEAESLAWLGTSCPDHFIRTKIRPLYVHWNPAGSPAELRAILDKELAQYARDYATYYQAHAVADSPAMRDPNPAIVLIPGIGMFSFGKSKTEARLAGEFYLNAIHVMEGASALADTAPNAKPINKPVKEYPQAGPAAPSSAFQCHANYVALPPSEAFRIEYWALEEAKIRRQPAEKPLSRRIAMVVGGGSGIGREVAILAAGHGAFVAVADRNLAAAEAVAHDLRALYGRDAAHAVAIDITQKDSIHTALGLVVSLCGGLDLLINTAALFPASADNTTSAAQWGKTLEINVTANYFLAEEAGRIFREQGLDASLVLTSSANAVVAKRGSEAYDVSKAAVSHLIRELAVSMAPLVRVNGISPATVIRGSTMFPRERVMASLTKYNIAFDTAASDDDLRNRLAEFYAQRTLTHQPIDPVDCARAILFLAGPETRCTTGHIFPVDGGLTEAFLR